MSSSGDDGSGPLVVPLGSQFSDGDSSRWPQGPRVRHADSTSYRKKLAKMYLEKKGMLVEGVDSILEKLPEGYAYLERPRPINTSDVDKYMWGHPSGTPFYTPAKFFVHFWYLMQDGQGKCSCDPCSKKVEYQSRGRVGRPPRALPTSTGQAVSLRERGSKVNNVPSDKEGTPDVFRGAILKLKSLKRLDEPIVESQSMDWRAERQSLQQHLTKLNLQNSFLPREGEVVLFASYMDGELLFDDESGSFRVFSFKENRWLGTPDWHAGTVGQTPEEHVVLEDLIQPTRKKWAINYSGFRVETFPDPNNADKSASLHVQYLPLSCIRPLNYWHVFLQGIPPERWQPSIHHALTIMSSVTLLDRYHIRGVWPDASIYCRGIYIGPELIVVGDAIRLKPRGYKLGQPMNVIDVMVVENIELRLLSCKDNLGTNVLAEDYAIRIRGKVYTTSSERARKVPGRTTPPRPLSHDELVTVFQHTGMGGYGNWFPIHTDRMLVEVSQDLVLGRCYEADAAKLLFEDLSLGLDLPGVVTGREYSRQTDGRIPLGKSWFWGDYRMETLALDSLNGEDVGRYNEARDPKMWRACLRIIDGKFTQNDLKAAGLPRDRGRPAGGSRFSEVGKMSKLVSSGLGTMTDMSTNVSSDEEETGESESDKELEGFTGALPVRRGTNEVQSGYYTPTLERELKRPKY